MDPRDRLRLRVEQFPDADAAEAAELTRRLRAHLLTLDVDSAEHAPETTPEEAQYGAVAKGAAEVGSWLLVRLGTATGLRTVLTALSGWATRAGHRVEVRYGDDILIVDRATSAQQERLIDDFVTRHTPGS